MASATMAKASADGEAESGSSDDQFGSQLGFGDQAATDGGMTGSGETVNLTDLPLGPSNVTSPAPTMLGAARKTPDRGVGSPKKGGQPKMAS